ncbi:MAG TPA: pyridoxal phosphate-dependent aminotransferase [Terriglobia bacterium]|nr:pyridoxal phosphate-dependent aminotransferase [Terriglobia bacterium]
MPMFAHRTGWRLAPNRLSLAIEEYRQQGRALLDLTESNPTRCGFNYDTEEILQALSDPRSLTYEPDAHGLLAARQAVAGYYAEQNIHVDPRQIFLTTSTSEAYSYVFRLLADPGDNILAPSPSYPLFDFLSQLNDLELIPYPLVDYDDWQIDVGALASRITARTRAILVVHPNNPTGSLVRKAELDSLIRCCQEHSLALIADEVFADYSLSADQAGKVASHAAVSDILTFTLSGLSKISALPQMKLAWIVVNGPADLLRSALARLELIADTYLSVAAPLAHALPKLLAGRRAIQSQILQRICQNLRWLDQQLPADSLVRRLKTAGGWYVILKLPTIRTDEDWALELLRQDGVLVHPGHFYDFPAEGHLVVSLLPTLENFKHGMEKLIARVGRSSAHQ